MPIIQNRIRLVTSTIAKSNLNRKLRKFPYQFSNEIGSIIIFLAAATALRFRATNFSFQSRTPRVGIETNKTRTTPRDQID